MDARQKFISHLKAQDISAVFHYLPLNLSDMGRRFGGFPGQCPVCEEVSDRLVRLPFFAGMTESDQQRVLESINTYR